MKDRLPKGWKWIVLNDVCKSASSNLTQKKLKDNNGKYPVFGASGHFKNIDFYHREEDYISIIKDGAGVGRVTLQRARSSVIGTLQYLIPKDNVDISYLYYFLLGVDFNKYVSGSTIPHIYFRDYKDEDFLLIPIKEQQKIVKVLDTTLGKIDQAIALIEENIEKLQQLNESVLDGVFNKNDDWKKDSLIDLTTKIGSGSTPRGGKNSYKETGISLIRSLNVYDEGFKKEGLAFIDEVQADKLSNVIIENNDVLLNITGASVARCCVVPNGVLPARVNQHVSILRVKKDILKSKFLHYQLISPTIKNKLLNGSSGGATREAITKKMQEEFIIQYPSLEKQVKIVQYLDATTQKNNQLIQQYQNKLDALKRLKNSVLDIAFKGKLKREVVQPQKELNIPFYQMQLIGFSIQANRTENIAQGEMAIAKDMYLLDRLYGVDTKMNFVNHSWGPFAPEIKKTINNKQYFSRKKFPNSPASYISLENGEKLLGKVNAELKQSVFTGIRDLNEKLFLKIPAYRRANTKELLATVLKCIEDTQSTDLKTIREAMKNWKIKQGEFKTKAEKFSGENTSRMIGFIRKMKWDLKVAK